MRIIWTPTGLSLDSVYKTKVAIYPNPSNGVINVEYKEIPVSKIDVVNVLGQVVKSIKIDPSKSQTSERIDMSGNANGIYIINVSTNETSSSYKVVLNK
ncbi:MAG TPA: T9SS type A sorting domain-containing protein [Flavobacterium sp.]|nr:T9SS type A sorting domain-containing protein [Flavobacterium sp.]